MIENAYVAAVASNKTEIFNKVQDYCIGPSVRAKSEDKWLFRDIQVYGNVQGIGKETGIWNGWFSNDTGVSLEERMTHTVALR